MNSVAFHSLYGRNIALTKRLAVVREHIHDCLLKIPAGPVRILSICAGDGRDLIGVLKDHPRAGDVKAILIEIDSKVVEVGRAEAKLADLELQIKFVNADASLSETYRKIEPADIVLLCGVLGNVVEGNNENIVALLSAVGKSGSSLVWTLNLDTRNGIDHSREFCQLLLDAGFVEIRKQIASRKRFLIRRPPRFLVNTFRYNGETSVLPLVPYLFEFETGK